MSGSGSGSGKKKAPIPSFSGMGMPMNVSIVDDDIGPETTRRVGGFTPTFEPVAFHGGPSMGAPPMMGPSSVNTRPQKAAAQTSTGIRSKPPTTIRAGWNLNDVPVLPEFHPLERSAVFVPHTSASEVARRVSVVLRDRSIDASYDNSKAKAKCVTADQVEFRVFLYRGQKNFGHGIIVEVQRRFGASTNYHEDVRAILDAAEGKVPPPPKLSRAELPLVSDSEDDYGESDVSDTSLDFVRKMLKHPGFDAHHLALQTLSSLTDPAKMGRSTARGVSKALISEDNDVGSKVFELIVDKKYDDEEFLGIRAMAMTVLANAITAVHGNVPRIMRETLRPVLSEQLKKAETNPQLAFLACKCLGPLIQGDHNASELYTLLEQAAAVGDARHAGLGVQATRCIEKIDGR